MSVLFTTAFVLYPVANRPYRPISQNPFRRTQFALQERKPALFRVSPCRVCADPPLHQSFPIRNPPTSVNDPANLASVPCSHHPEASSYPLGPPGAPARLSPRYWFRGLIDDLHRRLPYYGSDWTDALRLKSIPVILYLYFACLAPVVAFGGLTSALTSGSMGIIEFLLSSGATGILYSIFAGQPLTFIAPTGLTLAFTVALYGFCGVAGIPFLGTYAWCGIWTSCMLLVASICNLSDLIKYCTRFTDDVFNSLIATNFLYEACRGLLGAFMVGGADKTRPFTGLIFAMGTYFMGRVLTGLRTSRYFVKRIRNTLADFGPVLTIAVMSLLAQVPAVKGVGLEMLKIPREFSLAGGRSLIVDFMATPISLRLVAIVPALLLTCLFFLDQNISSRVVNAPQHRLKKGPGYHLDMLVLAVCTFGCAVMGLPLMCAGTVQSLAHLNALAEVESRGGRDVIVSVVENRLTALCIHTGILSSVFLLPVVQRIPMAVISGLFLFLGRNMMNGNEFLNRIRFVFMDPELQPKDSPMRSLPAKQVNVFTAMQFACLIALWVLKLNKKTSMFFPSVIATLMFIRSFLMPKLLSKDTLDTLDGELVQTDEDRRNDLDPTDPKPSTAS